MAESRGARADEYRPLLVRMIPFLSGQLENFCSGALHAILAHSSEARYAVDRLLQETVPSLPATSLWLTQDVGADGLRPDLAGYDNSGRLVVLVECKFFAGFTAGQPKGYLERADERDAMVVFLVPTIRAREVAQHLALSDGSNRSFAVGTGDRTIWRTERPAGHPVLTLDWQTLLQAVLDGISVDNTALRGDVEDLLAMTKEIEGELVPWNEGDAASDFPRKMRMLQKAIFAIQERLFESGFVKRRQRMMIIDGQQAVRLAVGPHAMNLSLHLDAWADHGVSPVWVTFFSKDAGTRARLAASIQRRLDDDEFVDVTPGEGGWAGVWFPLSLREGVSFTQMVDEASARLLKVVKDVAQIQETTAEAMPQGHHSELEGSDTDT